MKQTYTHEFQCVYILGNYPFDKQTCSINIETSEIDSSSLSLIPKKLWMEQDRDMTLFNMEYWNLDFKNKDASEEGISMTIILRRKILSEMMSTYLPSVLLLMITLASLALASLASLISSMMNMVMPVLSFTTGADGGDNITVYSHS